MDRIKNGVRGLPDLSILISCYLISGWHVEGYKLGEQLTLVTYCKNRVNTPPPDTALETANHQAL